VSLATKLAFPFACTKCGEGFGAYAIRCPACGKGAVTRVRPASAEGAATPVSRFKPTYLRTDAQPPRRIPTGLATLDLALGGGFVADEGVAYILTGGPGAGKSTLGLLCAEVVPGSRYCAAEGAPAMWNQLATRTGRGGRVPFHFTSSLDDILEIARAETVGLLVVDQLHALEPRGQAFEHAKRLVTFAHDHRTCVLVLGEHAKDGTVRGSGSIEYAFDVSMLLEQPLAYDAEVPGQARADRAAEDREARWLTTSKNRYGPTGTWKMRLGEKGWAQNEPEDPQPPPVH